MIASPPKGYAPKEYSLRNLNLSGNEIKEWPALPFKALQLLDLSANQLKEFKCQEGHMEALEYLYLSKNHLTYLEINCENLRNLELQENELKTLTPLNLEKLKLLDAESNQF